MRANRSTAALLTVAGLVMLSAALMARAQSGPDAKVKAAGQAPPFKPVMNVHDMMEGQNKLFGEITDAITDKKFRDAAKAAWLLAEIANVNQYQHDEAAYRAFAKKMSEDCVTLARALKKQDEKASIEARRLVGQSCQSCHDQYKK